MSFKALDLSAWVAKAPPNKRYFREAVHIVLTAIGSSSVLRSTMVMKGGLLLAIRYDSTRFTKDADFSTKEKYEKADASALLEELDQQIDLANQQMQYDTICLRQRAELRPAGVNKKYPTLSVNIGYAQRSKAREFERLQNKQSSSIVQIDYSYNEAVYDVDVLSLGDGEKIQAYSLLNLLAEKYRSLLQQPVRHRNRRQDVYDIHFLIEKINLSPIEKAQLLDLLISSSRARDIDPSRESIASPDVKNMAQAGYAELAPEIQGVLPPFVDAYTSVTDFYEQLPWQSGSSPDKEM